MFIEFRFVPSNFTVVPSFGPIVLFCIHSEKLKTYQYLNRMNELQNHQKRTKLRNQALGRFNSNGFHFEM